MNVCSDLYKYNNTSSRVLDLTNSSSYVQCLPQIMSLGTNRCARPSGIIVRLHLRLECVMESVRHEVLQFRQVSGSHCHCRAL